MHAPVLPGAGVLTTAAGLGSLFTSCSLGQPAIRRLAGSTYIRYALRCPTSDDRDLSSTDRRSPAIGFFGLPPSPGRSHHRREHGYPSHHTLGTAWRDHSASDERRLLCRATQLPSRLRRRPLLGSVRFCRNRPQGHRSGTRCVSPSTLEMEPRLAWKSARSSSA